MVSSLISRPLNRNFLVAELHLPRPDRLESKLESVLPILFSTLHDRLPFYHQIGTGIVLEKIQQVFMLKSR